MMSRKMSFAKINELDSKQQKDLGKGFKHSHLCHDLLNLYMRVCMVLHSSTDDSETRIFSNIYGEIYTFLK